jgi:electron transport complex protein RnfG
VSASILRTSTTLAVIAALCTLLVAGTWQLTREKIRDNEQAYLESSLRPVLPDLEFGESITQSRMILEPPHGLPGSEPAVIYRVYDDGRPVAALFAVTARDGYAGPIRVLIGIRENGTVSGVRILSHRETPGLGDRIVASRSDWLQQFPGKSLGEPPLPGWHLETDGGEFDQITGASVTPRAVLRAIRETLLYFTENRDAVFASAQAQEQ